MVVVLACSFCGRPGTDWVPTPCRICQPPVVPDERYALTPADRADLRAVEEFERRMKRHKTWH